jgi:myo-inositol-1(or 4)-monophosphatase
MTAATERAERYAFAQSLARRAGALANDYFRDRERLVVELKGPQDFVSHADRDVEALLRREIAAAYPGDAFLGEDTAASFNGALDSCWVRSGESRGGKECDRLC